MSTSRRLGEVEWMDMTLLPGRGQPAADNADAAATGSGAQKQPRRERLQSLDAVRGLNIIVMMFVDDTPFDSLDHAAWDGAYHLADFVMPLFLFM
jgi:predicted acyltransferase